LDPRKNNFFVPSFLFAIKMTTLNSFSENIAKELDGLTNYKIRVTFSHLIPRPSRQAYGLISLAMDLWC